MWCVREGDKKREPYCFLTSLSFSPSSFSFQNFSLSLSLSLSHSVLFFYSYGLLPILNTKKSLRYMREKEIEKGRDEDNLSILFYLSHSLSVS